MDVVQGVGSLSDGAASLGDWFSVHWKDVLTYTGLILLGWFVVNRIGKPVWSKIEETILSNWRLALLGATGVVLSLASGWTTWDGMRNFTQEPLLSFMITFGIQGVMLIVAWLIGETFATGMSVQAAGAPSRSNKGMPAVRGGIIGVLLFLVLMAIVLQSTGAIDPTADSSWNKFGDKFLIAAAGVLITALLLVYATSDIIKPYMQGSRVILKNAVLWVMFLACMTTSVFFSFDSLFSAIFPQSERTRAADLRAQNQVAGIVADIGQTVEKRTTQEAEALFTSPGWQAYDEQLTNLAVAAQGAEGEIERYFSEQVEAKNRTIKEQQERIATAQSSQAGIANKKTSLVEERSRLAAERPELAAIYAQKKSELDAKAREVDAKRVEAMAEDKGVEGTGKVGKGPIYRERMAELAKLRAIYKIAEERANNAKKRLTGVESRIARIDRELATIDGDLATFHAEAQTAEQRIQLAKGTGEENEAQRIDPARILANFKRAKAEFRQEPNLAHFANLNQQCAQLRGAMASTEVTKARIRGNDCDPKQANEAAAVLFALNRGAKAFSSNCAGGERLEANRGADQLFGFARKCLADSGLPSQETDELRTKINSAELNRDDKAHRFVVTWNAFQDGNRLAYLALGIAIAIDLLVFMSGLFGANAVRSPLSDVPSYKARTAQQLEAIIENALLPDTFETARLTLQSLRPITNVSGFMAEVRPEQLDPHSAGRVLAVLNAGATIHAVEYDVPGQRYLVRAELFEFLSLVAKKAFEASDHHVNLAELDKIVEVALLPDVNRNADTVLHYIHPISEDRDFTGEIKLDDVKPEDIRVVRSTLNAGATLDRVQRAGKDTTHYFVHRDFYRTLAVIRARTLPRDYGQQQIDYVPQQETFGGALIEPSKAIEDKRHGEDDAEPVANRIDTLDETAAAEKKAQYLEELLDTLHIDLSAYERCAEQGASEASKAFAQMLYGNRLLDDALGHPDKRLMDALDSGFERIRNRLRPDQLREQQLLAEAHNEIGARWDELTLLPNGPYEIKVGELVGELETANANGDLRPEDQELLKIASALVDAFRGNGRGKEFSWDRLAGSFKQIFHDSTASHDSDTVVTFNRDKRTSN